MTKSVACIKQYKLVFYTNSGQISARWGLTSSTVSIFGISFRPKTNLVYTHVDQFYWIILEDYDDIFRPVNELGPLWDELAAELGLVFTHLFQQSVDTGEIPEEGSLANICPLLKKVYCQDVPTLPKRQNVPPLLPPKKNKIMIIIIISQDVHNWEVKVYPSEKSKRTQTKTKEVKTYPPPSHPAKKKK